LRTKPLNLLLQGLENLTYDEDKIIESNCRQSVLKKKLTQVILINYKFTTLSISALGNK